MENDKTPETMEKRWVEGKKEVFGNLS